MEKKSYKDPELNRQREEKYKKYIMPWYNMIYKLCLKYAFSYVNVDDCFCMVLATLYKGIDTYNPERSIQTWIHICTRRKVNLINKQMQPAAMEDTDAMPTNLADDDSESWRGMGLDNYRDQLGDEVACALDALAEPLRVSFLLRVFGYTDREIADIEKDMGLLESGSTDTVKSRIALARKALRKMLKDYGKRK